jgi:dCTP deaminase
MGLATYNEHILDAKKHNQIDYFEIPEEGLFFIRIFFISA